MTVRLDFEYMNHTQVGYCTFLRFSDRPLRIRKAEVLDRKNLTE